MSSNLIIHVTEENFQTEVLDSKIPVLIDFWAEWCGPCRMLAPTLDALAEDSEGKVKAGKLKIVKVDIEAAKSIAVRFGVRGIPTLMMFKDGEQKDTKVGVVPRSQIEALIESAL